MVKVDSINREKKGVLKIAYKELDKELKKVGLERFLSQVYKRNLTLTQLMIEVGVEEKVVESLKMRNLSLIVGEIINHLKYQITKTESGNRRFEIVNRYFGLDGNMPAKLTTLGAKHKISRERARQIKERCLHQMRYADSIKQLEELIVILSYQYRRRVFENLDSGTVDGGNDDSVALLSHRNLSMVGDTASLTDEQRTAYLGLLNCNRVKVVGCSGSGKTMLAILLAMKLASSGKKVLFTCYNKALAVYLDSVFANQPNLTVSSYHALCLRLGNLAKVKIPGGWTVRTFDKKYPKVLERAVEIDPNLKFDSIIVDDAQNFKMKWWQSLIACLTDPKTGGLYCFMDDNRLFYERKNQQPDFKLLFELKKNLRSPKRLMPLLQAGYISNDKMNPLGITGTFPEFYSCKSKSDVTTTVTHLVDELTSTTGMKASEIAILTHKIEKESTTYGITTKRNGPLILRYSPSSRHAIISRVAKFSGLEKRCVILADLDDEFARMDEEEKLKLIYLAASRCSERFIMVGNRSGWGAINLIRPMAVSQSEFVASMGTDNINANI